MLSAILLEPKKWKRFRLNAPSLVSNTIELETVDLFRFDTSQLNSYFSRTTEGVELLTASKWRITQLCTFPNRRPATMLKFFPESQKQRIGETKIYVKKYFYSDCFWEIPFVLKRAFICLILLCAFEYTKRSTLRSPHTTVLQDLESPYMASQLKTNFQETLRVAELTQRGIAAMWNIL